MTAKQAALKDIRQDLRSMSKSFITFNPKLDPVMESLTKEYIHRQKTVGK